MKLDHVMAGVMTQSCGMDTPVEDFLPPEVVIVSKDCLRAFSHSKRVGNYLLGRTLGEGSFAKVKEGLHTITGEKVAIKIIDKKKAKEDAYVRKNLRREGKLLQLVRHPNVVQLLEIMETEHSYYLVTEFCQGGDLMEMICASKRLSEDTVRPFIRQIVSAIEYLHKAGILHRDLKVENLLLDEQKNIKIIDFGLSNSVRVSPSKEGHRGHEFCVTQCGSPAYAAPELLGNQKYGPKVDIWSIGVNMFAMLTGNLPFTVEPFNIKVLHNKMLKRDMNQIPEHLSDDCVDLLRRFLTPDPENRVTLLEAMDHPWLTQNGADPLEPAPFPNKLNYDDLNQDIVKHMSTHLDYRLSEVIRMVTKNIPNNSTATYQLFEKKLSRYNVTVARGEKKPDSRIQTPRGSKQTMSKKSVTDSGRSPKTPTPRPIPRPTRANTTPRMRVVKTSDSKVSRLDRDTSRNSGHSSDGSNAGTEKTLVRRRIQNARVLARMQEEDESQKAKFTNPDSETEELEEAEEVTSDVDDDEIVDSQESGVGTGSDSVNTDINSYMKDTSPVAFGDDDSDYTMLTPRAIELDLPLSGGGDGRFPEINTRAIRPRAGKIRPPPLSLLLERHAPRSQKEDVVQQTDENIVHGKILTKRLSVRNMDYALPIGDQQTPRKQAILRRVLSKPSENRYGNGDGDVPLQGTRDDVFWYRPHCNEQQQLPTQNTFADSKSTQVPQFTPRNSQRHLLTERTKYYENGKESNRIKDGLNLSINGAKAELVELPTLKHTFLRGQGFSTTPRQYSYGMKIGRL